MPDRLEVRQVSKRYQGVAALRNVDFTLRAGEVHALAGENGAGKSTILRIVAGSERPDSGEISIDGRTVSLNHPRVSQRLGIGIIYQELDLFPHLTAGENMVAGNLCFAERWYVRRAAIEEFCRPFLERVGLRCDTRTPTSSLSIGQQQLLAAARALSMNCRVLLMDEPTSSLFGDAAEKLFGVIAALKADGVSVVYVSHKMDEIFRVCDRITVLRDGETVGTLDAANTTPAEVVRLMVGRSVDLPVQPEPRAVGPAVLSVSGLTTAKLKDVSFELRAGEVLGIAGLVGSGRSELGAALFGMDRIEQGAIRLNGRPFSPRSPSDAMRNGLGLLPEDRKLQGLMMHMSVLENGVMAGPPGTRRWGFVLPRREAATMGPVCGRLALKCESYGAAVNTLSGGNQQKALLARLLLCDLRVIFLDDPARGIDVAAKEDVYRMIDELARSGKGVLLVSSELSELLRCSSRILVISEGRAAATFTAAEATPERIMAAALAAQVPA